MFTVSIWSLCVLVNNNLVIYCVGGSSVSHVTIIFYLLWMAGLHFRTGSWSCKT